MLALVFGWTFVTAAIVFVANHYWRSSDPRSEAWQAQQAEERLTSEDSELLRQYAGQCEQLLLNLLSQNSPEGVSPFVFNRLDAFSDIIKYYQSNPGTQITDSNIMMHRMSVIHLPEGPAIEGQWITEDGRLIDVVFRRQDDQWLVDWHHFARFSEHPWALFLAGDGPDEAEFRLLVRQRLLRQVLLDESEDRLSLAFHAPRFGRPDDPGPASSAFDLEWDDERAKLLMAGFNQAREGNRPFGSILPPPEPDEDMMRVRIVIRRIDGENERIFEIVDVLACHWLQLDHPGVSPGQIDDTDPQ